MKYLYPDPITEKLSLTNYFQSFEKKILFFLFFDHHNIFLYMLHIDHQKNRCQQSFYHDTNMSMYHESKNTQTNIEKKRRRRRKRKKELQGKKTKNNG